MDIRDAEPLTENVCDLDFIFVGNVQTAITLLLDKGDSITWTGASATIRKGLEVVTVFRAHILYYSQRSRKRLLPVKKIGPDQPATPPVTS